MNRKNTILIAVMINSGLLAVLLIAALTSQEEVVQESAVIAEAPVSLPAFDDRPLFSQEIAALPIEKPLELPQEQVTEAPVHKLPALAAAAPQEPVFVAKVIETTVANEVAVKKGDTLEKIAKAHHTSVSELIKLNRLPSSFLKIGQVIKIPAERALVQSAPIQKKPVEMSPEYYTIKVGENPWAIAMKHHMKVEELLRLNGLNEEKARKLKAGDRLRIR